MNTLNRYEIRSILRHLDSATALLPRDLILAESSAAWHIRMAKERLLRACVGDVEVEAVEREAA